MTVLHREATPIEEPRHEDQRPQPDPGRLVSITDGAVNGTVKVDIGNGTIVTASITEEAIADLGLAEGDQVTVIVKASDVMIGK